MVLGFLVLAAFSLSSASALSPCVGDTRGDHRCNHDPTHRVCAQIGIAGTSFWHFTGQNNWCGSVDEYGSGGQQQPIRCPPSAPTWCICKWATAAWIKGQGCDETVQIDCAATDICDLKSSYKDFEEDLTPARTCVAQKCPVEWNACGSVV